MCIRDRFKTLVLPPLVPPYTEKYVSYITEDLFDNDPSNIEFLVDYGYFDTGLLQSVHMVGIYREDGTLLDSLARVHGTFTSSAPAVLENAHTNILNTPTGAVMRLLNDTTGRWQFYSLPGTLPCLDCSGSMTMSGDPGAEFVHDIGSLWIYPNPSSGATVVEYRLPLGTTDAELLVFAPEGREVSRIRLTAAQERIILDTSPFAAGTYTVMISDRMGKTLGTRNLVVR